MDKEYERALAWAAQRKRQGETVIISPCPCCKELIAVYVEQTARNELVPDTTLPKPLSEFATSDTFHNSV